MNIFFRPLALCLRPLAVLFCCLLVADAGFADSSSLTAYTSVMPGLDYLHYQDTNGPLSIHIARLDRANPSFEIVSTHAKNHIAALATVVAQVGELPAQAGKPFVAVNGDFFVLAKGPYQGDPLGLQILDGELSSAPGGATFWMEPGGKYHAGNIRSRFTVTWPHGGTSSFGLNEARKSNNIVLFTPTFGESTRTTNGVEFVLEPVKGKNWLPLKADEFYTARVQKVSATNTPLTPDSMVLSLGPEVAEHFSGIHAGAILKLYTGTTVDVRRAENAIGGRPVLLKNGELAHWPAEKGTNGPPHNPRTAIGWNAHYFYAVVVDGRQKQLSMGMTLTQLAHFMQELGCTEAINLDGGGSTTFWMNGKVLNSPSDKHLRTVANTLMIVKREPAPAGKS